MFSWGPRTLAQTLQVIIALLILLVFALVAAGPRGHAGSSVKQDWEISQATF